MNGASKKRILPVIAALLIACLWAGPVSASAAESDISGSLLSGIGLTYAEISGKYGGGADVSGFEGELSAVFGHNTYHFRPSGAGGAAYSGCAPFDVIPEDGAVCYAIGTTAGALFPWLDGSCSVAGLASRGFSAAAASSRQAAFAGEIEGDFCHLVYEGRVIDIELTTGGNQVVASFSKDSAAFITAADAGGPGQDGLFGEWAKTGSGYGYESLTKFCLYPDYVFTATVNLLDRMGCLSGTYSIDGGSVRCTVLSRDFSGYTGADIAQFELLYSGGTMQYLGGAMGDLAFLEGPEVLEKIRAYPAEPAAGWAPSGPFEPYMLQLHYGCPVYEQPSARSATAAYISFSTLYTIVEEQTDGYGVVWGKLKSGAGWVCLPPSYIPPDGAAARQAYTRILDEYKAACEADAYGRETLSLLYPDVNETMMFYYHGLGSSSFYACYQDINADGADELLIGCGTDEYISIVDLYLFDGTQAVKAIENDTLGDRSRLTIYANGTLLEEGSNGAASGSVTLYRMNHAGTGLDKIFAYSYYGENGVCWYYDGNGAAISREEYYRQLDEQTGAQAEAELFLWEPLAGPRDP